jgi:hypothetical protein
MTLAFVDHLRYKSSRGKWFSLLQKHSYWLWGPFTLYKGFFPQLYRSWSMWLIFYLYLAFRLMCTIAHLPHMPSSCAQQLLYLFMERLTSLPPSKSAGLLQKECCWLVNECVSVQTTATPTVPWLHFCAFSRLLQADARIIPLIWLWPLTHRFLFATHLSAIRHITVGTREDWWYGTNSSMSCVILPVHKSLRFIMNSECTAFYQLFEINISLYVHWTCTFFFVSVHYSQ